ncbi:hypothetical protein EF096_07940 [Pseudomonas neustonica]|uniref:Uncharacterized protein n=1 Tax=Pseudomonas neustonica TaxID=2487346 RepID=A0ABX9XLQ6_9PSED|nr:hypothetical protein EF099_09080 [Pseudomonas sp. SSM44]ROZ85463.1 hypothetical protein EF096_07940 [Pseudomonas neustonica]
MLGSGCSIGLVVNVLTACAPAVISWAT